MIYTISVRFYQDLPDRITNSIIVYYDRTTTPLRFHYVVTTLFVHINILTFPLYSQVSLRKHATKGINTLRGCGAKSRRYQQNEVVELSWLGRIRIVVRSY